MFPYYSLKTISLFIFYLLSLSKVKADKFREIIKITPSNKYFVLLNTGFYLYDNNLMNCYKIYTFDSSIYNDNSHVNLIEIENENKYYILCLIDDHLFIYDSQRYKLNIEKLNNINSDKNYYCNLMPYKSKQNNNILNFIIVYYTGESIIKFNCYKYILYDKRLESNIFQFENIKADGIKINCQINNNLSHINCFHYYNNNNYYLLSSVFEINNDIDSNININISQKYNFTLNNTVKIIKVALSENNKYFICLIAGNDKRLVCYINDYNSSTLYILNCIMGTGFYDAYKIYYFKETGYFMSNARVTLNTILVNSLNDSIELCDDKNKFSRQEEHLDDFSIIYNNSINDYKLLNYTNFKNSPLCQDISNLTLFDQITTSYLLTTIPYHTSYFNLESKSTYINHETEAFSETEFVENEISNMNTNLIIKSDIISNNNYNLVTTDENIILNPKTENINMKSDTIPKNNLVTNKTKEEIFNNINNVLIDKEIGEIYQIKGDDFTMIIKPTNSTPLPNMTYIEFDGCERIIRKKYNISNSSIITFVQIEIENKDDNSLYNQIKYFSFDEEMKELDLSICKDVDTQIHYAIKDNTKLDVSSISDFKELGIDILNLKDRFFTDLCYSYSDSNKDMILEDRIKYIYQNYSLCEKGCSYDSIDIENMNIVCNCKIKGNDNSSSLTITSLFYEQPNDISFMDSNIGVIKCYKMVFSMYNKQKNIGFILFSFLFLLYLIFAICFCKKGIQPIKDYLLNKMDKNGYLENKEKQDTNIEREKKSEYKSNNNNTEAFNKKKTNILQKKRKKNKTRIFNINQAEQNKGKTGLTNKLNKRKIRKTKKKNKKKKIKSENNDDDKNDFGIIKMNLNDIKSYYPKNSNQSLHNYTFDEAIKYDKRNIFRIAYIYLLSKQIIFRTFFQKSPLELFSLSFILFIFMFSTDLALNALFYFNDNISKKYTYAKNLFLFTFSNNITIIIYSTLLSHFLITLLSKLTNSSNSLRNVFLKVEQKIKTNKKYKINEQMKLNIKEQVLDILKYLKIKITILLLLETILFLSFWYFVTAFCHVYSSTQMSWLLDSFLSILSRFFIELLFAFFFGKLYQISVVSNIKTIYKIIICIYDYV